MKIQELAIVFILIILPISLVLAEYTQTQIRTLNLQTEYDSKLTSATYDAIKAFQLNAKNETYSDTANSRAKNIEASVNSFRNSIISAFKLNGYSEEEIDNYIPALVYTLYDGFYIYSPFTNIAEVEKDPDTGEENVKYNYNASSRDDMDYGLKSYISYSCRYRPNASTDVVITYALDNFITVEGKVNGEYVSKSGYLIDNINVVGGNVTYNGVAIEEETLKEYLPNSQNQTGYPYMRYQGTKYYRINDKIVYVANGKIREQYTITGNYEKFDLWKDKIMNNDFAIQYYKQAYDFTNWFYSVPVLANLKYEDAIDQSIDSAGNVTLVNIWDGDSTKIFKDSNHNIEDELSNFNKHRLKVIRHKIEVNLSIAIANYNSFSNANNVFQMQLIKDDEWEQITHNISLISFLQGLPIGGKIYNGYTLVTNDESEEVVIEENIYILAQRNDGTKAYHKVGDSGFLSGGNLRIDMGNYGSRSISAAGRLNLDFQRVTLTSDTQSLFFYPLKDFNASYSSIVMQDSVETYDDIYEYINSHSNSELKKAFYTALGRERAGKFNANIKMEI